MTKEELIIEAKSKGIEIPEKATKSTIEQMLKDAVEERETDSSLEWGSIPSMSMARPPFQVPDCHGVLQVINWNAGTFRPGKSQWANKIRADFRVGDSVLMMLPAGMLVAHYERAGDKEVLIHEETGKPTAPKDAVKGERYYANKAFDTYFINGNAVWEWEVTS